MLVFLLALKAVIDKELVQTEHVTRAGPPQIPITCPFTDKEISNAWEKCAHTVQEHSDHMVKRWKEEIDMFLVFVRRHLVGAVDTLACTC